MEGLCVLLSARKVHIARILRSRANHYQSHCGRGLSDTNRLYVTPLPRVTRMCTCLSSMCLRSRAMHMPRLPSLRLWRLQLVDSEWFLLRSISTVVGSEGTHCKGPAVQNHSLPLSFWPTTCTSGSVEKMPEWREGKKLQRMDANNVGESISDTHQKNFLVKELLCNLTKYCSTL